MDTGDFIITKTPEFGNPTRRICDADGHIIDKQEQIIETYPQTDENGNVMLDDDGNGTLLTRTSWVSTAGIFGGGMNNYGMPGGCQIEIPKMGSVDGLAQLLGTSPEKMNITKTVDWSDVGVYKMEFTVDHGDGTQTSYKVQWAEGQEFGLYSYDEAGNQLATRRYDINNGQLTYDWDSGIYEIETIIPVDPEPINPEPIRPEPENPVHAPKNIANLAGLDMDSITNAEYDETGRLVSFGDNMLYAGGEGPHYIVQYLEDGSFIIFKEQGGVETPRIVEGTYYDKDGNVINQWQERLDQPVMPKIELPADSITVPKEGSIEGIAKMYGVSADEIQVIERSGTYGVNTKITFMLPIAQTCDEPASTFTAQWVDGKFFVTLAEGGINVNQTSETKCYDENGNVFGTSKTTNPKEGASDLGYGAVDISDVEVGSLDFVAKLAGLSEYHLSSSASVKRDEQGRIVSWKQMSMGMFDAIPDFEVKVNYNDDGTYTVSIIDGNGNYNDKNTTINTYNSKGDLIQQSEQKLLAKGMIQMPIDAPIGIIDDTIEPWLMEKDLYYLGENENMISQEDLIKATDLYTKYKAGTISSQSLFSNLDKYEDEEEEI